LVDGVRTAGEMSGRLVRVDGQTADAIKAGQMAKDAAGQMLAQVRTSSGQFSHVTRLSAVGKLAAVTSMTSALSAMALQAQLDRIERQLAAITEKVDAVHDELLLQWHSELRGISLTLGEVHRTAIAAQTFTQAQWDQITPLGAQINGHLDADLKRLAKAAVQLAQLGEQANLTRRSAAIPERVDDVERAHRAALASVTAWIRFSELRLWHLTATDDPTLPAYQAELITQLDVISTDLSELPWKVRKDVQELTSPGRWWRRTYHRRGARRLPVVVEESVARLNGIDWDPVRPKSRDVVPALDAPGTSSGLQ
jgi:hypothetical protein